jgi:hypothetical protein
MSSIGFFADIEHDSVLLIVKRSNSIVKSTTSLPIFVLSLNTFKEEEFLCETSPTKIFCKGEIKEELSCDPHTNVPHWDHYKTPIQDLKELTSLLNMKHIDSILKRTTFRSRRPENVFEIVFFAMDRALNWLNNKRPRNMWIFKPHHFFHNGSRAMEFGFFKGISSLSFVFKHDRTNCIIVNGMISDKDTNLELDNNRAHQSEIERNVFNFALFNGFQVAKFIDEDSSMYVSDQSVILDMIDVEIYFKCIGFFGKQCFSNYPNDVPSKSNINIIYS